MKWSRPKRVAFDSPSLAPDGSGGQEAGWSEEYICSARFAYLRGGETVMAGRLEGKQPVIARIRRNSASLQINPTWRLRETSTGEAFNIRSAQPTPDEMEVDILCESGVAI